MDTVVKLSTILMPILFLTACASTNCILKDKKKINVNKKLREAFAPEDNQDRAFVYKFDGSKQCGLGNKISLSEMKKELKGIKVHSSYKKNDGMLRVSVCGAPTGEANVFEIDNSNLKKTVKLGYKIWSNGNVEN